MSPSNRTSAAAKRLSPTTSTLQDRIQAWVDSSPERDPLDPLAPHYYELRRLDYETYCDVVGKVRRTFPHK